MERGYQCTLMSGCWVDGWEVFVYFGGWAVDVGSSVGRIGERIFGECVFSCGLCTEML